MAKATIEVPSYYFPASRMGYRRHVVRSASIDGLFFEKFSPQSL